MSHPLDPNSPATRLRGPLLVGAPAEMSIAAVNGSSTTPLVSFYNAPEIGFFVDSSSKISLAAPGVTVMQMTSDFFSVGTTTLLTTANADTFPYLVIPVSSGNMSSADTPTSLNGMCALVWAQSTVTPGAKGTIWAFTTRSTGWMASTSLALTATSTGPA